MRAVQAMAFSRVARERALAGVRKYKSATTMQEIGSASPKSHASRRFMGVLLIERQIYEPSSAMHVAAFRRA